MPCRKAEHPSVDFVAYQKFGQSGRIWVLCLSFPRLEISRPDGRKEGLLQNAIKENKKAAYVCEGRSVREERASGAKGIIHLYSHDKKRGERLRDLKHNPRNL